MLKAENIWRFLPIQAVNRSTRACDAHARTPTPTHTVSPSSLVFHYGFCMSRMNLYFVKPLILWNLYNKIVDQSPP